MITCLKCGAENSPLAGETDSRCLKCGAPLAAVGMGRSALPATEPPPGDPASAAARAVSGRISARSGQGPKPSDPPAAAKSAEDHSPLRWFAACVAGLAATVCLGSLAVVFAMLDTIEGPSIATWWTCLVSVGFLLLSLILHQLARIADAVERQKP